jgi:hypothetical protein
VIIQATDEQFDQLHDALYYHCGKFICREDPTIGAGFDSDKMLLRRFGIRPALKYIGIRPALKYMSTPFARGTILRYRAVSGAPPEP